MNHHSLFELNSLVKNVLSQHLQPSYWVVAEIGEMRLNQKGHCYLELIEQENDEVIAKAKATIWAYTYRNLSAWFESITQQSIQTGLKLLMNVQVQFHEVFGFSLNIRDIDPTYTLGESEKKKTAVLEKLTKEGIIDMNRELMLPVVPQRIAIISSPTAAGYEDFIDQLEKNPDNFFIQTHLFKAIMQGQEALFSIPEALRRIHQRINDFDLVVIIRGGGSQVDLDCYDSYDICSHIAQFPIPVITGIGHERDESIADRVAHTRLKTPTATAEFLLIGFREFENELLSLRQRIHRVAETRIENERLDLDAFANSIRLLSRGLIQSNVTKLNFFETQMIKLPVSFLSINRTALKNYDERLRLLDPKSILKRGFTISTINNVLLKNVKGISMGDLLVTQTHDSFIESDIKNIYQDGEKQQI
jgi:exodeoxyribonuclease VII large subunit